MRHVVVVPRRSALEERVAHDMLAVIRHDLEAKTRVDIVITGGSVGIGVLAAMRAATNSSLPIDWNRVHVWWGDERFVPAHHEDRNDQQAWDALLSWISIPAENVHSFPTADGTPLGDACSSFASVVEREFDGNPNFDIVLSGIGPDGHVASLFPGRFHGNAGDIVIAVNDSPKPPAERLSFTFDALNTAEVMWIVAAGSDKQAAISELLSEQSDDEIPARMLNGRTSTVVYLDSDAAGDVTSTA